LSTVPSALRPFAGLRYGFGEVAPASVAFFLATMPASSRKNKANAFLMRPQTLSFHGRPQAPRAVRLSLPRTQNDAMRGGAASAMPSDARTA